VIIAWVVLSVHARVLSATGSLASRLILSVLAPMMRKATSECPRTCIFQISLRSENFLDSLLSLYLFIKTRAQHTRRDRCPCHRFSRPCRPPVLPCDEALMNPRIPFIRSILRNHCRAPILYVMKEQVTFIVDQLKEDHTALMDTW
jgi:hypothetical protein